MSQNTIRVPTQVHTRELDRAVAHNNMKRAGWRKVNKYGYFKLWWKDYINIPTLDLRRKVNG